MHSEILTFNISSLKSAETLTDLKKKSELKKSLKILFFVFYNFSDPKKFKYYFGAECTENVVIKLEITI